MAPRRYGVASDGSIQPLWHGKLAEDFTEADTLRFMADTDIQLSGNVSADTLAAIRRAGYRYEGGEVLPRPGKEEMTMSEEKPPLPLKPLSRRGWRCSPERRPDREYHRPAHGPTAIFQAFGTWAVLLSAGEPRANLARSITAPPPSLAFPSGLGRRSPLPPSSFRPPTGP